MGEFDDLIKQLTEAGATDEEITSIIQEQISNKQTNPQQWSPTVDQQDQLRRSTLGNINPLLAIPGVADAGLSLGVGTVGLYEAGKGIMGLQSGGYAPKLIDKAEEAIFGGTSKDLTEKLNSLKSPSLQASESNVQNAEGFMGTAKSYIDNPGAIASGIIETIPSVVGGGVAAKAGLTVATKIGGKAATFAATKLGQAVAGGFGEGLVTMGSSSEAIRTNNEDKLLRADQTGLAVLSGVLTGAFGVLGGRIAQKLDVADIDNFLVTKEGKKLSSGASASKIAYQKLVNIFKGGIAEGTFEELPQSLQEQALQNIAMDRPWDEGLAEAAASGWMLGTVMGGGMNVLTPVQSAEKDINDLEAEADNISTGDTDLDAAIDESVAFVKQQFEKEDSIEGAKIEEDLTKAQQAELKAKEKLAEESRRRLIAEKALEFERAPVVPRNLDPISQAQAAQEEEALQGAAPAYVKPALSTQDTTVSLNKNGDDYAVTAGEEPIGYITNVNVTDKYVTAYPGLNKEGQGFGQKAYIALAKLYPTKHIVSGDMSPQARHMWEALYKKGFAKRFEEGKNGLGDTEYSYQLNKNGLQTKVSTPKTKVGKAIAKAKAVKAKVVEKLVEPKVKAAPKVDLEAVAKKEAEAKEDTRVKLTNYIDKALARKPAAAVLRLEELVTKAEEAGLPELAKEIETIRTKKQDEIDNNAKNRAEAKALAQKRKANVLSKEERAAANLAKKEAAKLKRESKSTNKKVVVGEKTTTLEKAKDSFLTNIAKTIFKEKGQAAVQKEVDAYQAFRKENKLKEVTDDSVKQKAQAYLGTARKAIETQGRQNTIDREAAAKAGLSLKDYREMKPDIKAAEAKGITLQEHLAEKENKIKEDKAFDEKKALDDFKKAAQGDYEVDGAIEDINFTTIGEKTKNQVIDFLEDNKIEKLPRQEITAEQYINLAPRSQHPILKGLMRVVDQYKSKSGSKTKFVTITVPEALVTKVPLGGFHMALTNSDNAYIAILVDEQGVPITNRQGRNTILHEYLHDYTKLMFTRLYSLDKSFRSKMNRTFGVIQNEVTKQTEKLYKKLETTKYENLTEQEKALHNAIFRYIDTTSANPEVIYSEQGLYAFSNVDEFLSELFSDPATAAFLSQVQMDERITTGAYKGQKKSLLYRWFEDFFDYVKEKFKLTPVQNSALDYALDSIVTYDVEFSQGELNRQEGNLVYNMLTFDKNVNKDSEAPSKTETKSIVTKPITKNIADTLWKRKDIKTFNDVKEYVNRVNGRLEKRQQLGENYPKVIYKIIGLRRAALESNKKIKSTLDQYVANNKDKFTNKQLQDLEDFAAVDLDNLKFSDLAVFTKGYSSLIYNGEVTPEAYNIMINEGKTAHMKTAVADIAPKLSKIGVDLASSLSNPATFSSLVGKYKEKIAGKFLSTFYGGLMQANSSANIESHRFYTELTTFAEKHGLKHNNLVRVGIYGSIFSTVANPETQPEAWKQEVKENAEFAVKAAEAKLQSKNDKTYRGILNKKEIEKEIELAKDIATKVAKNRSMENILDKNEQAVYDKIRAFADTHEADFKRNAAGIWKNEDIRLRYNYFPTLAQGKVGSELTSDVKSRADELIRTSADNASDALLTNNKDSEAYNKLFAKKVWSNYERLNPKGYFYEFDALAISKRWGKSLLYDIYASSELKALNKLMQDRETIKELGVPLHQAILKQLKSITSSGYTQDNEVGDVMRFVMKGRDALYTASLATAGQLLLQSSSGFVGAAVISANINPLKAGQTMAKATKAAGLSMYKGSKLNTFLDETGLGVQLRNISFETYLTPTDYRTSLGPKRLKKFSTNATQFALQSADKFAARMVWFAAFFDAGGTLENPTKEAVLKAERMVGLLQNMSDISFSAPIFKYNTVAKKILAGMFYAYKSFALNSFIALASAGPRVLKSKEARVVVTAQLGSLIAYHTLAAIAVRPFYKMIVDALLGKDDDDDEEEKSYTVADQIKSGVTWDLMVGMYAPSIVDQMARWWFNEGLAKKIYGNEYEEFDKYKDSPLSGPADLTDSYANLMGPGMREPAKVIEDGLKLSAMYLAQDEYFQSLEEQEKYGYAKEDFAYSTAALLMGSVTYLPLRGDVKRLIEGVKNQKKRDRRKESGSGTIYDSELESDYESPDYENELEEQSLEEFLDDN